MRAIVYIKGHNLIMKCQIKFAMVPSVANGKGCCAKRVNPQIVGNIAYAGDCTTTTQMNDYFANDLGLLRYLST